MIIAMLIWSMFKGISIILNAEWTMGNPNMD